MAASLKIFGVVEEIGVRNAEFLSGDPEFKAVGLACRDDDCVKTVEQLDCVADLRVELERHQIVVADEFPVAFDDFVRKSVFGDHAERSADFVAALEDRDFEAVLRKQRGCRKPGGTGSDDGNCVPVLRERDLFRFFASEVVKDRCLDLRDVDREVDPGARAGLHAELVGADEAAGLAHRVGAGDRRDRVVPLLGFRVLDKFTRVAVDGAGCHAGLRFAVETAFYLLAKLQLG